MLAQVVTLDSIVQAKFVTIRSVSAADAQGGYDVRLRPTNESEGDVCVHVSKARAEAIGLSPTA